MRLLVGFVAIFATFCQGNEDVEEKEDEDEANEDYLMCSGQYCLPKDYKKLELPMVDGEAIEVGMRLSVQQISKIDDKDFTMSLNVDLGLEWKDPRIITTSPNQTEAYGVLDLGMLEYLWLPDIYLYNLKSVRSLNILTPFAGDHLVD